MAHPYLHKQEQTTSLAYGQRNLRDKYKLALHKVLELSHGRTRRLSRYLTHIENIFSKNMTALKCGVFFPLPCTKSTGLLQVLTRKMCPPEPLPSATLKARLPWLPCRSLELP